MWEEGVSRNLEANRKEGKSLEYNRIAFIFISAKALKCLSMIKTYAMPIYPFLVVVANFT